MSSETTSIVTLALCLVAPELGRPTGGDDLEDEKTGEQVDVGEGSHGGQSWQAHSQLHLEVRLSLSSFSAKMKIINKIVKMKICSGCLQMCAEVN